MGTRADFYVGRGKQAEWLGSVAYDGHPQSIGNGVLAATSEGQYRERVTTLLDTRDDATKPEQGWPWPWNDSRTTDYAYAFDGGNVWASSFGHEWFVGVEKEPDWGDDDIGKVAEFPDMTDRKNVAWDRRSGLMFIRVPR